MALELFIEVVVGWCALAVIAATLWAAWCERKAEEREIVVRQVLSARKQSARNGF